MDGVLGININKYIVLKDVFIYKFFSFCIYRMVNEIVYMKFYMYFIYYFIFCFKCFIVEISFLLYDNDVNGFCM